MLQRSAAATTTKEIGGLKTLDKSLAISVRLGVSSTASLLSRSCSLQVLAKYAVPWRNDNRNRAVRLRLASETDQWLWFRGVDVTKLLDLLAFTHGDVRKFLCTTENADPTSSARCRTTLNRNRSLDSAWIDLAPVARAIVCGAPGEVLRYCSVCTSQRRRFRRE